MDPVASKALRWHMDKHGTKIADLVRQTGVSRSVINKLLSREGNSTAAENVVMIAAYYGKTVNQFLAMEEVSDWQVAENLWELMTPEERRLMRAQMHGLLASRAS